MASQFSIISPKAQIGDNVTIGDFVKIHDNVILGDNCIIEDYCELGVENGLCSGAPLIIGANAHIRSKTILYADTLIGDHFVTGHHATIREKCQIGRNVQIGTLGDVQNECIIGDYVKMQSNAYIAHKSQIGNYVWIFPHVVLTNDPHPPSNTLQGCIIDDFAAIGAMSVLLPGIKIGKDSLVAAHSTVTKDVDDERIVIGSPAKDAGHVSRIKLTDNPEKPAYPWRKHFHRGYAAEDVEKWMNEIANG